MWRKKNSQKHATSTWGKKLSNYICSIRKEVGNFQISIKRGREVNYFILSQAEKNKLIEARKNHLLCIHENLLLNCATEERKQHQIKLFLSFFFLSQMMKKCLKNFSFARDFRLRSSQRAIAHKFRSHCSSCSSHCRIFYERENLMFINSLSSNCNLIFFPQKFPRHCKQFFMIVKERVKENVADDWN